MAHTVKQVAALSGISVRTLHFYDEIGLLRPAHVGANGYRFYEEPQLLILQQILFFRELGLELKQIKAILGRDDFDVIKALQSHREVLQGNLDRTRRLIETIDKTIQHLKGIGKMANEDMFAGFTIARGGDRFGEQTVLGGPGGEPIDCKVSAQDTSGALCIFEFTCQSGGPKHFHLEQDEWIYIIDGNFEFHIDGSQRRLGPGESIFIPRKVPHVWACADARPGRIINLYQPAGKMEAFFREIGKYDGNPALHEALSVEQLHQLFADYGMDLLGPPLGWKD